MQGFWQHDGERNWRQRRERRTGLAAELVLIHSNSLSRWLSLFQPARCSVASSADPGESPGRCAGRVPPDRKGKVGVDWPGPHSW